MDIVVGKLLSMVLFLVSLLLSAVLPLILTHRRKISGHAAATKRGQTIINACNSLAGGILLATCFVALIPFVERSYLKAFQSRAELSTHNVNYPYAEITILGGFFLVIFIEQLVTCQHQNNSGAGRFGSGLSAQYVPGPLVVTFPYQSLSFETLLPAVPAQSEQEEKLSQRDARSNQYSAERDALFSDEEEYTDYEANKSSGAAGDGDKLIDNNQSAAPNNHHSEPGHSHNHLAQAKSLLHSVILVVTLGIHTLFEGMSIGLITTVDLLVALDIAVLFHAVCCAVALGMNISQQKISLRSAVLVCVVFSLMMPVGIGLGLALGEIKGFGGLILAAILQGIATGTFIYVLFVEIIPSAMSESSGSNTMVQMLFMLAGCVVMTLVIVFSHHHEQEEHSPTSTSPYPPLNITTNATVLPS